jgi:hypothetical protein
MNDAKAFERLCDALRGAGKAVLNGGSTAKAQCPAHDDNNPSLSIKPRDDGAGVVLHCHAGCDYTDVLAALNLAPRDLFDEPAQRAAYSDRNTYQYPDGRTVHRGRDNNGKKTFRQSGNTKGTALFHADKITAQTRYVYVPEGEKDVLAIESECAFAVCSAMGAGKAHKFDWTPLTGKHVTVVADRDEPGRKHAREIADIVAPLAASVCIVEAAAGKDAADHIAAGYGLDEFVQIELDAPELDGAPITNGAHPYSDVPPPDEPPAPQQPDEVPADEVSTAPQSGDNPSRFFDRDGLLAQDLATTVMETITCGFSDIDERFYIYDSGVWKPNKGRIETEIARLLGNRYRNAHSRNAMDLIRYSPNTRRITRDPLPRYINVGNGMVDGRRENWRRTRPITAPPCSCPSNTTRRPHARSSTSSSPRCCPTTAYRSSGS